MTVINASYVRFNLVLGSGLVLDPSTVLPLVPLILMAWFVWSPSAARLLKTTHATIRGNPWTYALLGFIVASFVAVILRGGPVWIVIGFALGFVPAYFAGKPHVPTQALLSYAGGGAISGSVLIILISQITSGVDGVVLDNFLTFLLMVTAMVIYYVKLIRPATK